MRILVVSDIHANLAALNAVIHDAGRFDQVWCLGDIVGYGPQPNECIERLRSFDLIVTAGNHDLAVTGKIGLWDFVEDARQMIFWTRHWLTRQNMDWLGALPEKSLQVQEDFTLVHASLRDPVWEAISDREAARDNLEFLATPCCLSGHTHIPAVFRKRQEGAKILQEPLRPNIPLSLGGDTLFINPGSVGQPRDEDPRAAYAMIDLQTRALTLHRAPYEIAQTQKLMKQAGLPGRLSRRLNFGQ